VTSHRIVWTQWLTLRRRNPGDFSLLRKAAYLPYDFGAEPAMKVCKITIHRCRPDRGIAAGKGEMPVLAERREIDKRDGRARAGAIGLDHCMREARFKIVVVLRVEPDLRQEVVFAELADRSDQTLATAADLTGAVRARAAGKIDDADDTLGFVVGDSRLLRAALHRASTRTKISDRRQRLGCRQ
jgi:hypothetical protein